MDRIRPKLGYVPGNVVVVSHKANAIKSNSTITELVEVARFYGRLTGEKLPTAIRMKGLFVPFVGVISPRLRFCSKTAGGHVPPTKHWRLQGGKCPVNELRPRSSISKLSFRSELRVSLGSIYQVSAPFHSELLTRFKGLGTLEDYLPERHDRSLRPAPISSRLASCNPLRRTRV